MNWVYFQGTTFNLDHITHFEIKGKESRSALNAYLCVGLDLSIQPHITVAKGTKQECEQWLKEIIVGKHDARQQTV